MCVCFVSSYDACNRGTGTLDRTVYGCGLTDGIFSSDSAFCWAAFHQGRIAKDDPNPAPIFIKIENSPKQYQGCTKNDFTTSTKSGEGALFSFSFLNYSIPNYYTVINTHAHIHIHTTVFAIIIILDLSMSMFVCLCKKIYIYVCVSVCVYTI